MNIYYFAAGYQNDRGMANSKEPKTYVCSICNKSMNRKISFEKHRKNCVEKTKGNFISMYKLINITKVFRFFFSGAKSRNFQPYQCPSPKMAQRSAGSLMESFQSRITEMYRWILIRIIVLKISTLFIRGRASYHEVEDVETGPSSSSSKPWHSVVDNIRNINFLHTHSQRKYVFIFQQ